MSSLVLYQVIVICILESKFQVSTADNNFLTGKKYFKILSFIFIMFDVTFWNEKIRQFEYTFQKGISYYFLTTLTRGYLSIILSWFCTFYTFIKCVEQTKDDR